jgi:UDP-N-acetylmuramyl pentapeptide phosphotransferase/UDP-N-acetylglucosamine-1-phosphate transferase
VVRVASAFNSLLILVIAAAASAAMITALMPFLARYAVARPNARSSHTQPTPQGGGIPVVSATILAVLAGAAIAGTAASTMVALWPLAAAVLVLAVTGACDDVFHLPVTPRFLAQLVAVGIVLAALPGEIRVVPFLPWWIERATLLVAGVYAVNVANFMDGLDWMTVAEAVPVTAALWILSLVGALTPVEAAVAIALLGAMIGFAPFNRPVAKLFLGDVGSLPIGLMLFWLLLRLAANGHLAAAIELPLYYVADATITLALRIARRENVLRAHRTHFYQRATDRGYSVAEVVTSVFFVNVALACLAIMTIDRPSAEARILALALGGVAVLVVLVRFARGKR